MYSQCTILQSYTKIQIFYNSDKDNVLILKTHNVDLVYILLLYLHIHKTYTVHIILID